MMKMKTKWLLFPVCSRKTRDKIREYTEIKNFPLYCQNADRKQYRYKTVCCLGL
ncbi:MAG: cysteine-rich KTR domain-containing protein [Pseudoruminococcus massiliensis]|uniref:cysteine-rich KTR domain-containing protein n=1 Tax=Pseudoruminococcus massiliensis TaxID=2086583 RepID=UPI002FB0159C